MFSYERIVFGIKPKYQISDAMKVFMQQYYCSIFISEHDAMDVDDCCDRPDVHYHGLVEFSNESKVRYLLMQFSFYCLYFKYGHCNNPAEYMAYITLAPKRAIVQKILDSSELLNYLQIASSVKLEILSRKREKKASHIERNMKVVQTIDNFLKSGKIRKCDLEHSILEAASRVSQKIVLNSPILVLSNRFEFQDGYLRPEESAQFVLDWCSYQNLDPKEMVENFVLCLDKKGEDRNSIYLQGSRNSGKTYIIQSIIEACIHVGQVMVESTSYSYVWEDCVDKRLIVLKEPHFSKLNYDQLDKILSGTGTLIYKHNDVVDYVPPTPVIILANEHDWTDDPELSEKIKKRFLCCYMNLKYFPCENLKKLHPRWLNLLKETFSGENSSKIRKDLKFSCESPFISNSGTNKGLQLVADASLKNAGKKSSSSIKYSSDCDLLSTENSKNMKQSSANTIQPNPKRWKRPMRDSGQDDGQTKMNRLNILNE